MLKFVFCQKYSVILFPRRDGLQPPSPLPSTSATMMKTAASSFNFHVVGSVKSSGSSSLFQNNIVRGTTKLLYQFVGTVRETFRLWSFLHLLVLNYLNYCYFKEVKYLFSTSIFILSLHMILDNIICSNSIQIVNITIHFSMYSC